MLFGVTLIAGWLLKRFKKILIALAAFSLLTAAVYAGWLWYAGRDPQHEFAEKAGVADTRLEAFRQDSRERLDVVTGRSGKIKRMKLMANKFLSIWLFRLPLQESQKLSLILCHHT